MKKVVFATVLVLTVGALCVSSISCKERLPAEEGRCELTYKPIGKSESLSHLARQYVYGTSKKPDGLIDLPASISGNLTYFMPILGGKAIPIVLDSSSQFKIYLDTNADSRLSDEKVFNSKRIPRGWWGPRMQERFGPITLRLDNVEERMQPKFYAFGDREHLLTFYPAGTRTGRIRLGSKAYRVKVTDGDFDGRYDTRMAFPLVQFWQPGCDLFAIDLNRDKRFDWNYYVNAEAAPLSRMVRVQGSYYDIGLAADGTTLELNKVDPNFGSLDLGGADVSLRLWSDAAHQYLVGSERKWQLPAGRYFALSVKLGLTDSDKSKWLFDSRETGQLKSFDIENGQTTVIEIGPPFSIKPTAERRKDKVSIGFELVGNVGERYRDKIKKNGRVQLPPIFEVVDESGKSLYSSTFEYDRDGFCRYPWRVPNDFKGRYQVKFDIDLGPFEKKQEEIWFTID